MADEYDESAEIVGEARGFDDPNSLVDCIIANEAEWTAWFDGHPNKDSIVDAMKAISDEFTEKLVDDQDLTSAKTIWGTLDAGSKKKIAEVWASHISVKNWFKKRC